MEVVKFKGIEVAITAANTVNNATVVRIYNSAASDGVLTVANASGTIANCTILTKSVIVVQKNPTDTLAGASMLAVPIAFSY